MKYFHLGNAEIVILMVNHRFREMVMKRWLKLNANFEIFPNNWHNDLR
jgi:hypothetical protein